MTDPIRVLHVDDDAAFLDLAAEALAREGTFDVTTETDPTAITERDLERFDAVVSDYEMPELTGLELFERILEWHPDLPCLIFTGKGSEAVASDAVSIGVTDYLQKERGLEQFTLLANRLQNAVEQARTTEELRREKRRRDRILEATPMGVVVHDADGAVTLVNERARELLGASTTEMDAESYPDASWSLTDTDGTAVDSASLPFTTVTRTGEPIHDVEYGLTRGDGTSMRIVVHGAPLRGPDDAIEGAVIVFGRA